MAYNGEKPGEIGRSLDMATDLLNASETALPKVISLREFALSLVPHVRDLHQQVNNILDILFHYSHARGTSGRRLLFSIYLTSLHPRA